jgi:hypothetical protein
MGLEIRRPKDTPTKYGDFTDKKEGDPCNTNWSYTSVMDMLMYLTSNSKPNISFSVHQPVVCKIPACALAHA